MSSLFFQISSVFYVILVAIIYFAKEKIATIENNIYKNIIVWILLTLIVDMASVYFGIKYPNSSITLPLCKLYLSCILIWVMLFTYYVFTISSQKNNGNIKIDDNENITYFKKASYIFIIIGIFINLGILLLPLNLYSGNGIMYTYGPCAIFSYGCGGLLIIYWIISILTNHRSIKNKKYWPAYTFFVLALISIFIQSTYPNILLVTSVAAYITVLTYFTIENPDIKMIEQLNVAKSQAERANRAKTDFLSSMSHEIRTPLNAIVGFSQALIEENISNEAREEVNDIIMSSNNLLEIVNGILDISKIEANKLEIVNTEYDSNKLMKEVISLIRARLASKPLDFRIEIDPTMPPVLYGDYIRIKQILINILTNAVKYTKEGYIAFTVNTVIQDDVCRLIMSVEDSGQGIKPEDIDKLFTKFQRFELEKNITTEGTGLGLAITKSLVELMNGKIVVQSKYGEGSKFTVSIDQRIIPKTSEELENIDTIDSAPFNASSSKILVVDDNNVNLKVANRLLKDYHANVTLVSSGQECLNKILDGEEYDLILLDDMMPRMTGTETLKNLKNIIGFSIPVVALTANAISGMRERYLALGFDDYLAKPINKDQLYVVLRKYLVESDGVILPQEDNTSKMQIVNVNNHTREFLESNGVDVERGLELLGDMGMYDTTMEDFYQEIDTKLEKINMYKEQRDMPNYAILVHSLKSDSKYLGFMKLAELAYNHEMASKENNQAFVDENYNELMDEAMRIYNVVKKYVGEGKDE